MCVKILIVESNLVNQKVICYFLEGLGYSCDVVATGAQTLQAVNKQPYGLVFMNLNISNMDGCQTATFMREVGFTMPIIAIATEDIPDDLRKCVQESMNDCLTKPFMNSDFRFVLNRYLRQDGDW